MDAKWLENQPKNDSQVLKRFKYESNFKED